MKTTTKLRLAAVLGILLVVGGLAGVKAAQIGKMIGAGKSFQPPPESVTTAKVESSEWQPQREAIGTLVAMRGVVLGAELPGTVREISFDSGSAVRKGTVLVRLDTSTEQAQLAAATAEATLARLNLERARSLRSAEANTPADLEAAEARAKQAEAAVAALEAVIAKKTIRAPFDGRIAIRQVELGQVVSAGAPVASLQSVDPIYVDFWMPQQSLAELKRNQKVHLHTDTFPGAGWEGAITTVNTEVDPGTRNVRVRATIPNADGRLLPGMFGKVEVLSGAPRPVLYVPATAVLFAPYGDSVYVLEPGKEPAKEGSKAAGEAPLVARQRFVRLGERRGDMVAVASGLTAGDTVVSSGAFKLRNGSSVVVKNELAPRAELDPKPAER